MAILNPEAESAAKVASLSEAKQRELAQAGYKHVEGAPAPLPLDLPHFSLRDLRAAIPKHCFERSFITSTYYMIKNLLTCAALFYAATYIDQTGNAAYLLWPVYWFFQGSYLTGIWVVAHECGHQAYCSSEVVNNLIGLVLHSALLVPYHSWRISHRKHHSNTGSCENDEVFVPVTRSVITSSWNETLEDSPLYQLYRIVYMLVVGWMPGYLFFNATGPTKYWGKPRSHFNPYSAIYADRERWMIVLSDIFLVLMIGVLSTLVYTFSFYTMLKFYIVPYFVVNAYLVLITYLQHTDTYIPHFREGEWNWLRGALCTVDRSFGPYLDSVVHRIVDTHVCHHIFSKMPFYHCEEATAHLFTSSTTDYNYTYSTPPKQLTYPPPITMSAPNAGRQSPEPERQSGAQSGQTSDNVNQQGAGPKEGAEKASDNAKDSLSSNPQHTLEKHAEETTSKKV